MKFFFMLAVSCFYLCHTIGQPIGSIVASEVRNDALFPSYAFYGEIGGVKRIYPPATVTVSAGTWYSTYESGIEGSVSAPAGILSSVACNGRVYALGLRFISPNWTTQLYSYDPINNQWALVSNYPGALPASRVQMFWTGSEIVCFSGFSGIIRGLRFNPTTSVWTPITTTGMPTPRADYSITCTGTHLIVWGGTPEGSGVAVSDGALFNLAENRWVPINNTGALSARSGHSATWIPTINKLFIWGGDYGINSLNTGAFFNPLTNTWDGAVSLTGTPVSRSRHTAVWTGSRVVIYGGTNRTGSTYTVQNSGGQYDPVSNLWTAVNPAPRTGGVSGHASTWTGTAMLVTGGGSSENTAQLYNPATNSWSVLTNMTDGFANHQAMLLDNMVIVLGGLTRDPSGSGLTGRHSKGARYFLTARIANVQNIDYNNVLYLYEKQY